MKISIAVPSYNYARYLSQCLDSIQQQSYNNFEVLIADGGSTDGSLEIIKRYCDSDERFRLVSREDEGQADAIRRAFHVATGDVFCFLNADDCYLHADAFKRVLEVFGQDPEVSLVSFGGYYLDASGKRIRKINYRYHPLDGFHWMRYRTAILQPATFWRKHVYEDADWPSSYHYVFDVVFFYQSYLRYQWREFSEPIAGYRLHGDNKSMMVRPSRVFELAAFEELKFGTGCFRARYLMAIGRIVKKLETWSIFGTRVARGLYLIINSLAFLSFYRLPSI